MRHVLGFELEQDHEKAIRRATGMEPEAAVELAAMGAIAELIEKGRRGLEADERIRRGELEVGRAVAA